MEFCPKCGSIIMIQDKKASCPKCNYKPKGNLKIQISEKMGKSAGVPVMRESELTTYPVTEMKCPKCKNKEAYFWTLQTRAADESETKFYKCVKCDHTWRDYK